MRNFKKLLGSFFCVGLTLIFVTTNSLAQDNKSGLPDTSKIYFGFGVGQASVDTGITSTTGTAKLDEDDIGFKGFVGFQGHENVAIEGFYANLGEASLSGNNGDTFVAGGTTYQFTASGSITSKATTMGLGLVGMLPVNEKFSPIIKFGFHSWETDYTVTSSNAASATLSDEGNDLFYGVGAQFNLNEKMAMRAMFERFKFDDEDVDFISAGLVVKF